MTQLVKLRNGSEEADMLVAVLMQSLKTLWQQSPLAVYELHQLCLNKNHQIFGTLSKPLEELNLVNAAVGGKHTVHDSIRNVVLSAVSGASLEMTIIDPRV